MRNLSTHWQRARTTTWVAGFRNAAGADSAERLAVFALRLLFAVLTDGIAAGAERLAF